MDTWGSFDVAGGGGGSTAALTDPTGAKANTYTYSPYGQITSASETVDNPYRYVGAHGYHHDTTTGLDKVGHRYLNTDLGRWTQQDPTGQDAYTYLYAKGNPCNLIDTSGAYSFSQFLYDYGAFLAGTFLCAGVAGVALAFTGPLTAALVGFACEYLLGVSFSLASPF